MSGAGNGLRDASTMRMALSGAAPLASRSQTSSVFNRSTELVRSAAVLVSIGPLRDGVGAGPIATASAPTCASARAATSPEGPVPTTATSCNWLLVAITPPPSSAEQVPTSIRTPEQNYDACDV